MDVHAVVSTERMHEIDVGITVYVRNTAFDLLRSTGFAEKNVKNSMAGCEVALILIPLERPGSSTEKARNGGFAWISGGN